MRQVRCCSVDHTMIQEWSIQFDLRKHLDRYLQTMFLYIEVPPYHDDIREDPTTYKREWLIRFVGVRHAANDLADQIVIDAIIRRISNTKLDNLENLYELASELNVDQPRHYSMCYFG